MSRPLARILAATAVPALVVAGLSAPAEAAPKFPDVPTVKQAAKVYRHLAGGGAAESEITEVRTVGKDCQLGAPFKKAVGTVAYYAGPNETGDGGTGAKPMVTATAYKFRSAKDAVKFMRPRLSKKQCTNETPGVTAKTKQIKFKLGDQRAGVQTTTIMNGVTTSVVHNLAVRAGKIVVVTTATSADQTAPSTKQSVKFAGVALKAAR